MDRGGVLPQRLAKGGPVLDDEAEAWRRGGASAGGVGTSTRPQGNRVV